MTQSRHQLRACLRLDTYPGAATFLLCVGVGVWLACELPMQGLVEGLLRDIGLSRAVRVDLEDLFRGARGAALGILQVALAAGLVFGNINVGIAAVGEARRAPGRVVLLLAPVACALACSTGVARELKLPQVLVAGLGAGCGLLVFAGLRWTVDRLVRWKVSRAVRPAPDACQLAAISDRFVTVSEHVQQIRSLLTRLDAITRPDRADPMRSVLDSVLRLAEEDLVRWRETRDALGLRLAAAHVLGTSLEGHEAHLESIRELDAALSEAVHRFTAELDIEAACAEASAVAPIQGEGRATSTATSST